MYLIYETKEEATDRADEQGRLLNFSHWIEGKGTRHLTTPTPTANGKWALDVSKYELSDSEINSTVNSFTPLEVEEPEI